MVRGRAPKHIYQRTIEIPIVDENCEIVAWSAEYPVFKENRLRHDAAERVIGEIRPAYIEIEDAKLAIRAGAPEGWDRPWRCLAICSTKAFKGRDIDETAPTLRVVARRDA